MTLGGDKDGKGGLQIQWPLVAVFATLLVSMATGAIQLGSVQTHVQINTARLDAIESRERDDDKSTAESRERMTRIESSFTGYQKRIDAMEDRHMRLFDADNAKVDRLEQRLNTLEQALATHRSRSTYEAPTPFEAPDTGNSNNGNVRRR